MISITVATFKVSILKIELISELFFEKAQGGKIV
jgi:hypothetical protein